MARAYQHLAVAVAFQETQPRRLRQLRVGVRPHGPAGFKALHRVMDAVASDDRFGTLRSQMDADMTRRVPRGKLQPYLVVERKVVTDELCLTCLDDGQDAVDEVRLRDR